MDIALQVIINAGTHVTSAKNEPVRQKNGDIIAGFLATDIGTLDGSGDYIPNEPVNSPRCGFVFIKGVPNVTVKKVHAKLSESHGDFTDPDNPVLLLKRKWGIRVSDISLAIRQQMIANKYITFTWVQVKNFLRNKAEDRLITDMDMTY